MSSNRETAQRSYEAFGRGDIPAVLGVLSPQVEWQVPASLPFEDQVGPEAVGQNIFAALANLFDDFGVEVREILDAGDDAVVALGAYRGTGRQTGKQLDPEFVHLWRFDPEGKVRFFRSYTDTHQWLEVLGTDEAATVPAQATARAVTPTTSV